MGARRTGRKSGRPTSQELVPDGEVSQFGIAELAALIGVRERTVTSWARMYEGVFPQKNESGKRSGREVILWWLWHRAPRPYARAIAEKALARINREEGIEIQEQQEKQSPKERHAEALLELDLQLKQAKVQKELGGLIEKAKLLESAARLCSDVAGMLASVEKSTGIPMTERVEPIYKRFVENVEKAAASGDGA